MNQQKLKEIEGKPLIKGSGKDIDHACVMEMVSYIADEPWSDHPKCACPILTQYAIVLNDRFNDEHRQRLKPFIPSLVGTRMNDETQIARKRLIMWRSVTVTYPIILDLFKMTDLASQLRNLSNSLEGMAQAVKILKDNKEKIYANADANADAYADAYANANANANANADAYANANADANAYANADAYADAYADANAYAYAYAKKIRENLAIAMIETLRLAIDVKIEKGTAQ